MNDATLTLTTVTDAHGRVWRPIAAAPRGEHYLATGMNRRRHSFDDAPGQMMFTTTRGETWQAVPIYNEKGIMVDVTWHTPPFFEATHWTTIINNPSHNPWRLPPCLT